MQSDIIFYAVQYCTIFKRVPEVRMVCAQVERIIREKLAVLMYNQGKGELITRHASQLQLSTILSVISR